MPSAINQTAKAELLVPDTLPRSNVFIVGNIVIKGNRKTKPVIILREIPFKVGEEYPMDELLKKFEDARKQLMNTSLFHTVIVAANKIEGNTVDVVVEVKERWYLFPVPYFKPVDRNINQWIVQQKANLARVDYGAKLLYDNATGHDDKLRLYLINGYTKQFSFSYNRPYIDKNLKWGISTSFGVGKGKEVNYNTIEDKQIFLKDPHVYLRSFVTARVELTYRRAIKTTHRFGIGYAQEYVKDTILKLNPDYLKSARSRSGYPEIYYDVSYFDLDYIPYPTKGYAFDVSISKRGFNNNINLWGLSAQGSASWHIARKTFINVNGFGAIKVPFRQPYINRRFLGYADVFMQGYEYYVIDGVAGGYLKTSLSREFLNFNIRVPVGKKRPAQNIPVRIFGKVFGNTGYVYDPEPGENALSNTMLYSGGFGIDILTFYDFTLKIEWTFNQLGQNGIFLHRKTIF